MRWPLSGDKIMAQTNWKRNQTNDLHDHLGKELKVGQLVAKPTVVGRSAILELRRVKNIKKGRVYLDPGHNYGYDQPLKYSGRVLIVEEAKNGN